jgi:hypothetical protein
MNALPSLPATLAALDSEALTLFAMLLGSGLIFYAIYSVRGVMETRAREATRREIAAYVAEGSIAPDDAAKLLSSQQSDAEATIADAVAWGTISAAKGETLIRSLRSTPSQAKPAPSRA